MYFSMKCDRIDTVYKVVKPCQRCLKVVGYSWASTRENLSSGGGGGGGGGGVCEQHRRRQACLSAQSYQGLCYSLFGKYQM